MNLASGTNIRTCHQIIYIGSEIYFHMIRKSQWASLLTQCYNAPIYDITGKEARIWELRNQFNIFGVDGGIHSNKSPKGHWSLTWVQLALLLKVRFLSKWLIRKYDCHICVISPNSKQSRYFNSGYENAFGLLLLHSDLKKKSFWEGVPHWPIFALP